MIVHWFSKLFWQLRAGGSLPGGILAWLRGSWVAAWKIVEVSKWLFFFPPYSQLLLEANNMQGILGAVKAMPDILLANRSREKNAAILKFLVAMEPSRKSLIYPTAMPEMKSCHQKATR